MATTAARAMARETWQDKGDAATMMGYCGDGGGGVGSEGGNKSDGSMTTTTGYGGDGGCLQHKFGASFALTSSE